MRRNNFLHFLILILFCSFVNAATPQNPVGVNRARALINAYLELSQVAGASVAVATKDGVLWEEGFGLSDLENNVPATAKTKFRLGSVSKMITMAAAMRLYERGVLDLDAPISRYVADLPESYGKVTIKQLAGHLAGVRHYKPEDFQNDSKHFSSVKEALKIFSGDPLVQEPGTKYLYSTFGYVLLSAAMEGAAKKDFLQIVDEEVFQILRLENLRPDQFREIIPNKTRYYQRAEGKIVHASYEDPSYKWAAAGMISNAGDLARFGAAHLNAGYFKQQTLDRMFTSQTTLDGKNTGVGLGWRIGTDWKGRKIFHHAGNIGGGRAVVMIYPEHDLAIAFTTNMSSEPAFVESTAQMIAEGFLNPESRAPQNLAGTYNLSGMNQEKPFSAKLVLSKQGDQYQGVLTGDFPVLAAAAKNGLPERINVASVMMNEKDPVLILITPFGIVDMSLQNTIDGYQFRFDEGPAKFEGEMNQTP